MNIKYKILKNSILAISVVIILNVFILYLLGFPPTATLQIQKYLLLLILLIGGFGIQVGLYTYLRYRSLVCSGTMLVSGGISSVSMLLCCSHYILTLLPFISLSIAAFLSKYTLYILLFGLISNIYGIFIMSKKIKKVGGKNE